MRKFTLILMVTIAGLAVAILLVPATHVGQHHLVLTTYFDDVHGLRPGAEVRVAGVHVGTVRTVQAHPEVRDRPAEVVMDLWTENKLRVPKDATVSVAEEGVLGNEYVAIDVSEATGETAQSGDTLRSHPTQILTTEQIVNRIKEAVQATSKAERPARKPTSKEKKSGADDQIPTTNN